MSKRISFTVYGNPIPKARARVGQGRAYTPESTAAWESEIRYRYAELGGTEFEGDVSVWMRFYRSDNRRCDADNLVKCVFDSLNGLAWRDDDQIAEHHAFKYRRRAHDGEPRLEIDITELGDTIPF